MKDHPLGQKGTWPNLGEIPTPAKALLTAVIFTMAIAMVGSLGQITVHDIIPTFFEEKTHEGHARAPVESSESASAGRGDLLGVQPAEEKHVGPFYKSEQFVWTLKWTHIHLFGINMIFIFMGFVTLFLNMSSRARVWLITLPFVGVLIDIGAIWLKGYITPTFFWLHIPGGGLFATVFVFVSSRALYEMWGPRPSSR